MLLYYITDHRQFAGDERSQRERLLEKIAEAARCGVDFIQLREKDLCPRELEALAHEAVRMVRENSLSSAGVARAPSPAAVRTLSFISRATEREIGNRKPETRLLINSRTDIALACGADGVHLTSTDIPASDARAVRGAVASRSDAENLGHRDVASYVSTPDGENVPATSAPTGHWPLATGNWCIAVSCHTPAEVRMAEAHGADFAVFAPVFEKTVPSVLHPFAQRNCARSMPGVGLAELREACAGAAAAKNVEGVEAGRMPVLALGGVTLENARACIEAGASGIAAIRLFQENDVARVVQQLRNL